MRARVGVTNGGCAGMSYTMDNVHLASRPSKAQNLPG